MEESTCGLSRFFGELAAQVPDGPPGYPDFVFHSGVLPEPPASLATDRIVFRKALHDYNSWYRPDALWMYLTAPKCRELGLFFLAAGFHGPRKMTSLAISHPDSAIRRINIVESELRLDDPPTGLTMAPFALRYYPAETREHPWIDDRDTRDLPVLGLSNADNSIATEEDWARRDTVWMEPSTGMFRFAELLLNAGCSWNSVREYSLEGDAGYRGVGPMSAELRIFLPGSQGWIFPSEDVPNTNQPSL